MKLTPKQVEILKKIERGNLDGSLIDLTQLRQSLSYTATKQAVLCSVNHLAKRDLVGRRDENQEMALYVPHLTLQAMVRRS